MPAVLLPTVLILAAIAFSGSMQASIECSQLPVADKIYMDLVMTDRLFNRNNRNKVIAEIYVKQQLLQFTKANRIEVRSFF